MDFKNPPNWRDFKKSKFRLTKGLLFLLLNQQKYLIDSLSLSRIGDEQLDTTYNSPDQPQHITDMLSEVSYYLYMARCTPVSVLKKFVRAIYVPVSINFLVYFVYKFILAYFLNNTGRVSFLCSTFV